MQLNVMAKAGRNRAEVPAMDEEVICKRMDFLRKLPLFSVLREDDLRAVSEKFRNRNYRKKEIVFHQGDETHDFYLIKSGKVRVFCNSPSGNETSIRVVSDNDMIGEFAPIDGVPRSATAQAITDCTLLELPQDKFLNCVMTVPDFAMTLLQLLVQKLRWVTEYAESIAQYDIGGRLLHIILHYNAKIGKELKRDKCYEVDLGLNQGDLASMVGARREWVNHLLREWREKGIIAFSRGRITILDLPAVEAERDRRIELLSENADW
jgi:CRP/FNR family transcriptional regulator